MNVSTEDYLRTLYAIYEKLKDKSEGLRSIDVAKELGISKPSVSAMIKKLISMNYLKAKPYSKIHFTRKGLKEALRVMHNHRVIEVFLRDILGYGLTKVHEEAHRLEHAFSEESIKRLDKFLKHPKKSPYGMKIPPKMR
ncbi:MAG: metal-dependent transcriptional regulator [Nanoarchaeota archaeon]|nr:metal-dependent transcriptional regulator [Nanoarchaeota archaeon]